MTGFWKLFGAAALVVAVAVAIVGALVLRTLNEAVDAHLAQRVRAQVTLLAAAVQPALATGDVAELDPLVHSLAAQLPGDRLTVLDAEGRVLADSHGDAQTMDNHASRPEVLAALRPDNAPVVRASSTLHEEMIYFAEAVRAGGRLVGYARVAVPVEDVRAERAALSSAVLWGAGLALIAGAVASAFLAASVRRPLREMSAFVGTIARGEAAARLPARSMGELSGLTEAINSMADQLAERIDRIVRDQSEIRAILGAMVEGVLAIDAQQRVVLLNEAAAEVLGASPEAARGKPVWEVTRLPEITELLARCLRTGQPAFLEARLAGEPRDRVLRLAASPLADAHGTCGSVLVLHDLTEVRRLEAVRRDFVVNVSHELKTPLTAMRGFLDAVLDDERLDPAVRQRFLARAREATERMIAIVGDLLTLARVEAEAGLLRLAPLDVRELCAEARDDATDAAALRSVQLQLDVPGEPVPVAGDREALVGAVDNLLDNAIKYSPAGGLVRLAVRREGGEAVIEVADRGPGIAPHETDRVWERFYRVDKSRSRELGGTGLGLSIVRNVAQAHGGRVSLDSELGRGSIFRIHLPVQSAGAPAVSC